MKKVYFAGTFTLKEASSLLLADRLRDDYRALLLGDPHKMINYQPHLLLRIEESFFHYVGPFYCEEAVNGDFSSTDCEIVVRQEYKQVMEADLVVCVFDTWPSVGTVVELEWAIQLNKRIIIIYEIEETEYTLPTGLWFAIQDAMQRAANVIIRNYKERSEVISIIKNELRRLDGDTYSPK